MNHHNDQETDESKKTKRLLLFIAGGVIFFLIILFNSGLGGGSDYDGLEANTITEVSETADTAATVPWDYRVTEAEVGDLIGSDMTLLPDNEMLPNDGNYGTGDHIWTLQYMDAEMTADNTGRSSVTLSAWRTIKSFASKEEAEQDMERLKLRLTTEAELVGVYKTEYNGETRCFAVLELPSGNRVKQPIDADRYDALKSADKASVILEEVHDFADYDLAYAKFRGWAT